MEFEGWVSRRFLFSAGFYFPQIFADGTQIAQSAFGLGGQWSLRDGFPAGFYFLQVFISRRLLFPADFRGWNADCAECVRPGGQWSLRDGFPAGLCFPQIIISRRFLFPADFRGWNADCAECVRPGASMEFEGWVSRRLLFPAGFYFPQIFADETQIAFGLGGNGV
jgi:hypothetical protein